MFGLSGFHLNTIDDIHTAIELLVVLIVVYNEILLEGIVSILHYSIKSDLERIPITLDVVHTDFLRA